ncbi:hypothetical protein KDK88_08620, partial [bacterium]|nr:hypothetical protein [bacterium]
MRRRIPTAILAVLLALLPAAARAEIEVTDNLVALAFHDVGLLGTGFVSPAWPSCRYPAASPVEHLFLGGLWVGAKDAAGARRVSTVVGSSNTLAAALERNEFAATGFLRRLSSLQNSEDYDPAALAPLHLETTLRDDPLFSPFGHTPLGLDVTWRALAWPQVALDDAVVLQAVITPRTQPLDSVAVGLWMDTTVGHMEFNQPFWNYYDDVNGALRPADGAPAAFMYERDADADAGLATSWIATQWLGASAPGAPGVSYNRHAYRQEPQEDDWYVPDGATDPRPGRFQSLQNGDWDVGVTPDGDFTRPGNWNGLLSAGPFGPLATGESLTVTLAVVCGADSLAVLEHVAALQAFYDSGFESIVALEDPAAPDVPPAAPGLAAASPNPFNPRTE